MPLYRRKNSLRLSGYDYSQSGAYFVTSVTYKRLYIFGNIADGDMLLSPLGQIVESCWHQIPEYYPQVDLDAFVIMPNHVHGIIILDDFKQKTPLGRIMNSFKGAVTRFARKATLNVDLDHPVWQRGYHDHIIRNENDYRSLAQYILSNPALWEEDRYSK